MRLVRVYSSALVLALGLLVLTSTGVGAASPCAPGRPSGRPPGEQPGSPGFPGRPPQYPPGQCQLQLSASSARAGTSITVAGDGYGPGSGVQLRLGSVVVGRASAGSDGRFSQPITIPADTTVGRLDVRATGIGSGGGAYEQSAALQVLAAAGATQPAAQAVPSSGAGLAAAPVAPDVLGSAALSNPAARESVAGRLGLPRTGFDALLAVGAGLALVAAGTGAVIAARRRKPVIL